MRAYLQTQLEVRACGSQDQSLPEEGSDPIVIAGQKRHYGYIFFFLSMPCPFPALCST